MKTKQLLATLLLVITFCFSGNVLAKQTGADQQLYNQIKKQGLNKPIRKALKKGVLSGSQICNSAFKAKKRQPMKVAEILSSNGVSRSAIIKAGIAAGYDVRVIAHGIRKGFKKRRWLPVCGNLGGDDPDDNPISKTKPGKRKRWKHRYCYR